MSKTVITGTGRSGTTFLIQLLTNCGFNTGWTREECEEELKKHPGLRGGIEHALNSERFQKSYIVKNPMFIYPEKLSKINIDSVIIPIRDLEATAKSRRMQNNLHNYGGFCFGASNLQEQIDINAKLIYNLVHWLERNMIVYHFIDFNSMITDSNYLYGKLVKVFGYDKRLFKLKEEHKKLANPEYVRF